jgi:hypothetical protein
LPYNSNCFHLQWQRLKHLVKHYQIGLSLILFTYNLFLYDLLVYIDTVLLYLLRFIKMVQYVYLTFFTDNFGHIIKHQFGDINLVVRVFFIYTGIFINSVHLIRTFLLSTFIIIIAIVYHLFLTSTDFNNPSRIQLICVGEVANSTNISFNVNMKHGVI